RLDRAGQPLLLLRRRWADRLRALLRAVLMKRISSRIASLLSALLLACSGSATFDAGTSDGGGDAGPLEPDAGDVSLPNPMDAGTDAAAPAFDAGPPDVGPPDAGPPDPDPVDAGPPEPTGPWVIHVSPTGNDARDGSTPE